MAVQLHEEPGRLTGRAGGAGGVREATQRAINYARGYGVLPIAAMGNEATDLNSPTVDPTSPDFPPGIEKTRTIDNSCRGWLGRELAR